MAVTLTDEDINALQRVVDDFRHKEAVALLNFLLPKIQEQKAEEIRRTKGATPPQMPVPAGGAPIEFIPSPAANGHAE